MKGFTVVIPSYNSSSYIRYALDSVKASSKGRCFEVIVIDDNSDDFEILKEVCGQYENLKILKKEKKTNAAHSRNLGIKNSCYDLIFLLDSDDVLLESAIDQRLILHEINHAGVIFGNYITKRGRKKIVSKMLWSGESIRDFIFVGGGDFRTSSVSIYKPFYKKTMFDESAFKHQDWVFGIKCCDAHEKISFDPKPISLINIGYDARMSSSLNLDASKYMINNYLNEQHHINSFSKKHWMDAIANKDSLAVEYYASIFLHKSLAGFILKIFYSFLGKRPLIWLSSRFLVLARKVKWSL